MLVKNEQLNVGRPNLVRSPRFISESVFYTQSVLFSPRFIPKSVLYNQSVVQSPYFIPILYWRYKHGWCQFMRDDFYEYELEPPWP